MEDLQETLNLIAQTLYDKKGFNILALDVRGVSTMSDYMVIVEGNVDRHVKALSGAVIQALQEQGERPIYVEGEEDANWIVVDYMEVIIHLFTPELRERYRLEELWSEGRIVDLDIEIQETASS